MPLPVDLVADLAQAVARAEAGDAEEAARGDALLGELREAWPSLEPEERDDLGRGIPLLKARLEARDGTATPPPALPSVGEAMATLGAVELRPGQDRAVVAALCGRDSLVVMATGSGKSLCYQLPALLLPGVTLVVSPLIALMRDQVIGLRERGVCAVALNSSQSEDEHRIARDEISSGRARVVYAAPERLRMGGFLALMAARGVSLAAVDEAHCASEWGHDFRPDYRDLARLLGPLRPRCVMALTATATARVQDDIVRRLSLSRPAHVATGADRPNIAFDAVDVGGGQGMEARKRAVVARLLAENGDRPAIVYLRTRRSCETLADHLSALGYAARPYHAQRTDRREVQDGFSAGTVRVVCATNAFGMGVDVPDIGLVVHHSLPESVEAYYQEAGRAGRDGQLSRAVLIFAVADIPGLRRRFQEAEISAEEVERRLRAMAGAADGDGIVDVSGGTLGDRGLMEIAMASRIGAFTRESAPGSVIRGRVETTRLGPEAREALAGEVAAEIGRRRRALQAIVDYGSRPACRRAALLTHFGDTSRPAPEGRCCDVCDPAGIAGLVDGGVLQATAAGAPGGRKAPLDADQTARLVRLRAWRAAEAERLGWPEHRLVSQALLEDVARGAPRTTAGLRAAGVPRRLVQRYGPALLAASTGAALPSGDDAEIAQRLWEALREWRQQQADGKPAYTVAPNRTLEDIARAMPSSRFELGEIHGVGPSFLERHAESLLELLDAHR